METKVITPTQIPPYLYHFTPHKNVPSILATGLRPARDRLGNPPAVWLNSEPVLLVGQTLLEVTTDGLDPKKFLVFADHPDGPFIYKGTIPPRNIKVYGRGPSRSLASKANLMTKEIVGSLPPTMSKPTKLREVVKQLHTKLTPQEWKKIEPNLPYILTTQGGMSKEDAELFIKNL